MLADLIPVGQPQGAGVFARHGGLFVFVAYRPRKEPLAVVCGRIGGWRKEGESWPDCVQRELREEIACDVRLISSDQCYFADPQGSARPIDLEDDPRPLLVSLQHLTGRGTGFYYNVVFRAELIGGPQPQREIDALLFFGEQHLAALSAGPLPLSTLRDQGALVIERQPLPEGAMVRLGRSVHILAELLAAGINV